MPYKSKSQQKYMNAAAARGEVDPTVVDEMNDKSRGKIKGLPEKVEAKKKGGGKQGKPKKGAYGDWAKHRKGGAGCGD